MAFLAVFLVKYRIEYVLALPLVVMLFTLYFIMSTRPGSTVQKPEKLFRETWLVVILVGLVVVFLVTSVVDIPLLDRLSEQHYIELK